MQKNSTIIIIRETFPGLGSERRRSESAEEDAKLFEEGRAEKNWQEIWGKRGNQDGWKCDDKRRRPWKQEKIIIWQRGEYKKIHLKQSIF